MEKIYECSFIDEFSETKMTICDLPTNNPVNIVDIINAYVMSPYGFEFMAVISGIIEIKEQNGFKVLPANTKIIKYYNI